MTAQWGPLGWMTLHGISLLYPDRPTANDKIQLQQFLQNFAESITCSYCERHFKAMFENYRKLHPEWANSRFDVFLFVCRAHNSVNKRLSKPLKKSVQDCLDSIVLATTYTPLPEFRKQYIEYVLKTMSREYSGDGAIKHGYAKAMQRINDTYWNSKIAGDTSGFPRDVNVLDLIPSEPTSQRIMTFNMSQPVVVQGTQPSLRLSGGRLRLIGNR